MRYKRMILSYLLHVANRSIKWFGTESEIDAFYKIKDSILKDHGVVIAQEVQKIPGKKCNSCGGTGQHARYSNTYPYKPYDWDQCWHCIGGWYKLPKWVLLDRIQFGKYIFHRPVQRIETVVNPFLLPKAVDGYIEHNAHKFGFQCILIIFLFFDNTIFKSMALSGWRHYKWRAKYKLKKLTKWSGWILWKPCYKPEYEFDNNDLPF